MKNITMPRVSLPQISGDSVKSTLKYIVYFRWTSAILSWLITSAGIAAECAFMVASLWMSVNANVHPFVLLYMSEDQSKYYTWLATVAYVALPEAILILAVVTTIGHIRTLVYHIGKKESFWPWVWCVLFGVPTLFFIVLSIATLDTSVKSVGATTLTVAAIGKMVDIQLPMWLVEMRAIAAYVYAFSSMLYHQIGHEQEKDRLFNKDSIIAQLKAECNDIVHMLLEKSALLLNNLREEKDAIIATLQQEKAEIVTRYQQEKAAMLAQFHQDTTQKEQVYQQEKAAMQHEIDMLSLQLQTAIADKNALNTALMQSSKSALDAWGEDVVSWLNGLNTSVSIEDIASKTNIDKRTLKVAMDRKELQVRGTNKNLIWVPSLKAYLEKHPPKSSQSSKNTMPMAAIKGQDTGPITGPIQRVANA